jgi:peptidoglycan/LPS O-acetylase OafA/YrhL
MHFRVLGWAGFVFFAAGLLILLFWPAGYPYGCGALLTAVTLYAAGLILVARQLAALRRKANEMMQRVAEEMERRKGQ